MQSHLKGANDLERCGHAEQYIKEVDWEQSKEKHSIVIEGNRATVSDSAPSLAPVIGIMTRRS
jgi:hypothetical protein